VQEIFNNVQKNEHCMKNAKALASFIGRSWVFVLNIFDDTCTKQDFSKFDLGASFDTTAIKNQQRQGSCCYKHNSAAKQCLSARVKLALPECHSE